MVRKIKGFTLIEVIVVIAIMAILLSIAIPLFNKWRIRYYIESDTKAIYSLLQEGRMKAFTNKKDLTFVITGKKACLKDETTNIKCIDLKNNFIGTVYISKRGTFNKTSVKYAGTANLNPAYDCVVTSYARAKLGEWDGSSCKAK